MPNLNVQGDYRYGYQGEYSEKDEETGLNAFQLRMYDSRINRWISPDPMGQYHSPYMAMDNRWNMSTDPTGGCTSCAECPDACGQLGLGAIPSGQSIDLNIDSGYFLQNGVSSSLLGASNLGSIYRNNINWDTSFFFQYELRAGLIGTGSVALGLAVDTQGNVGVFGTGTVGAGPFAGAFTAWSAGISTADSIYDLEGYGFNGGALVTASLEIGFAFSAETNITADSARFWEGLSGQDVGVTVGLPIQAGTIGFGVGGYADLSYTKILFSGNINQAVDYMLNSIRAAGDTSVSRAQITSGINYIRTTN